MRFDADAGESGRLRANSRDNSEKVEVWMSAPGVGVRPRGLRLLRPCSKPKGHHVPPRLQQIQILISHAGMIERTRQIEAEVISRLSHFRDCRRGRKTRITFRENFGENSSLLVARDDIKPNAENIG